MGGGKLEIKSKNAFTLIELLAIIVILAIIAVITVPIILNIIENSRMGAATDSAYGYKDAVNKWYVTKLQTDNQFQLASSYTISSDGKLGDNVIPLSGDKPSGGYLNYSNNTLTGGCLVIGDYAVTFEGGNATSTIKGTCSSSSNNSENEQGNSGNEQATNPYLTRFDGTYTYTSTDSFEDNGEGGFVPVDFNDEWNIYLRNDGTKNELCKVYGNGQSGTVCATSSYFNSSYSSVGNYASDFEDVSTTTFNITTAEGLEATGLKGYSLEKAKELLTKGASHCSIDKTNEPFVECSKENIGSFTISSIGFVEGSNGQGDFLNVKVDGTVSYY